MKKISIWIIIISSFGIAMSNLAILMNSGCRADIASAISFIGLGIGAILLGIWRLRDKK